MYNYFKVRLSKKLIILTIGMGLSLSILQLAQSINSDLLKNNIFHDSPYSKWFSIDPFNFSPVIFFLILPMLASMPVSMILHEDMKSGILNQLRSKYKLKSILSGYAVVSFIVGFCAVFIPLALNFITYLLLLPNIRPDNLVNSNMLIVGRNTLFVSIFYQHPLIHVISSIVWSSFWGGLFTIFAVGVSIWAKNKYLALFSGLILQMFLLILNTFLNLSKLGSYVPKDFLSETSATNIDLRLVVGITAIFIVVNTLLFKLGRMKIAA